jgi:hypothetical protein
MGKEGATPPTYIIKRNTYKTSYGTTTREI